MRAGINMNGGIQIRSRVAVQTLTYGFAGVAWPLTVNHTYVSFDSDQIGNEYLIVSQFT